MKYVLVSLGGALGSLTRYVTGTMIMTRFRGLFPLGTLIINIAGSFLIGLLMTLLTERGQLSPYWRLALVVGFLEDSRHFQALSTKRTGPSAMAGNGSEF